MIAPINRHQILPYLGYSKSVSEEAPDDIQVVTLCLSPKGKIKYVIFPNDLESLRDPCTRVLHVTYIELWELWGLGVLTGATYDHRVTHPPLVVRTGTR